MFQNENMSEKKSIDKQNNTIFRLKTYPKKIKMSRSKVAFRLDSLNWKNFK